MAKFDAGQLLQDQGFQLVGPGEAYGQVRVKDQEGKDTTLDLNAMAKEQGIEAPEFEFNQPSQALGTSPLNPVQRGTLAAFGNAKGQAEWLKQKFGDIAYDQESGFVVKNKGVWQQVDPSGWGDPWDLTQVLNEVRGDLTEFSTAVAPAVAGSAVGAGVGAKAGAALGALVGPAGAAIGGTVGGIAGAGIGGAAAFAATSSLGRLVGTYSATDEEQLRDIGIEFILNAGGQSIPLGVKGAVAGVAGVKRLTQAMGFISKHASEESKGVIRQMAAETLSPMTEGGPKIVENLLDRPAEVEAIMKLHVGKDVSVRQMAYGNAKEAAVREAVSAARKGLGASYVKAKGELVASANSTDLSIDFADLATQARMELQERGLAVLEDGILRAPTSVDAAKMANKGVQALPITKEHAPVVERIIADLDGYLSTLKPAEKGDAAAQAMEFRKRLNEVIRQNTAGKEGIPGKVIDDIRSVYANKIASKFEGIGLGDKYMEIAQPYIEAGDVVSALERTVGDTSNLTASDTFLNQVIKNPGGARNRALEVLQEHGGAEANAAIGRLMDLESARIATSWVPPGLKARHLMSPGAYVVSPRSLLYTSKGLKFMAGLDKAKMVELLRTPGAISNIARIMSQSSEEEAVMTEQLMQQAQGAANGQ